VSQDMARTAQLPPLSRTERRELAKASRARSDGRNLLTIPEAADYLSVHPRTIYRLIKGGELRSSQIAGRLRVRPGDLDDFIDRNISS
jgi:excisionase family DNA binding protein